MLGSDPYGDHWVTVYQAHEESNGNGLYKFVDNWGRHNKVIEAHWTIGVVGIDEY